jgi:biopolymer transport protein ExbD
MKNKFAYASLLLAIPLFVVACMKKLPEDTIGSNGVPSGISIVLPRNLSNGDREPAVLKESAVTVSVPAEDQFYVGREPVPKDAVGDMVSRRLKGQAEADRIVYVAGGAFIDYRNIVGVIDKIRKEGVTRIGLLVDQQSRSGEAPSLLRVQIPAEPDPNEDLSKSKPNALILVVSISRDLKLELNGEPMGTAADTIRLTQTLTRIFQECKKRHAYKPGMETRTDVPEDERIEKTIIVKAYRSNKYGDVAQLIDAIKGAGANVIVLQIDDLSD